MEYINLQLSYKQLITHHRLEFAYNINRVTRLHRAPPPLRRQCQIDWTEKKKHTECESLTCCAECFSWDFFGVSVSRNAFLRSKAIVFSLLLISSNCKNKFKQIRVKIKATGICSLEIENVFNFKSKRVVAIYRFLFSESFALNCIDESENLLFA